MEKEFCKHKPIPVETGEWWYYGCFFQKNEHPSLLSYCVFQDSETEMVIGSTNSFVRAKELAIGNQCFDFSSGIIKGDYLGKKINPRLI